MKSAQYADSLPELISPNEKQSFSYFATLWVSIRESFFKFCCSFLLLFSSWGYFLDKKKEQQHKKSFGNELHFRGNVFLL